MKVREMTDDEMNRMGWHPDNIYGNPTVLEMDDGEVIFPSQDPEMNGPGELFILDENGDVMEFDV